MRLRNIWMCALGVTLAATVACGGGEKASSTSGDASSPAATPSGMKVDESKAGGIKGTIAFEGTAPKNEPIKMNADPACVKANPTPQNQETYMVSSDGKALGNVFVYVKDGLGNRAFPTPSEPVVLDQKGCHYTPHVLGIQIGQPLQIVNSDDTLHNVHGLAKSNKEFNQGQPIQGMKMTHTFSTKEVMIPFKCDVHGWMNAWIGVLDHPYYAVTSTDGTFSLKGLPPGTYTIEAWHEKLGTQTQTVTVGEKETKDLAFSFKA